jgi:thymidine phosphorylase
MKDVAEARALAESMVSIGTLNGVRTEAIITDMDAPLGRAVGNSLEIIECVETLKSNGPPDLTAVVRRVAARMIVLAGVQANEQDAAHAVDDALASGRALETFRRMVERQGGNPRVVDDYGLLPGAPGREVIRSPRDGFVASLHAEFIGRASNVLGAGRNAVGESIDHGVGVMVLAKPGDRVSSGQPLVELHHRDGRGVEDALAFCGEAFELADAAPEPRPKILGEVR